MSETAPVYRADPYRSWEEGDDLDRYAAALRAARGVAPPSDPSQDARFADWDPADLAGLRRLQGAVAAVLADYFTRSDLDWIVEETLFQASRLLEQGGWLHLPEVGRLELTFSDHGRSGRLIPSRPSEEDLP